MIDFEWPDDEDDEDDEVPSNIVDVHPNTVTLELDANLVRNCQLCNINGDGTLPDAKAVVELAIELACSMAERAGEMIVHDVKGWNAVEYMTITGTNTKGDSDLGKLEF